MLIKRTRYGKEEEFERKEKATNYDIAKQFRFSSEQYKKFEEVCEFNDQKPSKVIRELINDYIGE